MTSCQAPDLAMVAWRMPASVSVLAQEPLTTWRRGVQGRRRRRPQGATPWMPCSPRGISDAAQYAGREDDGRSRALRRRVTLIYGGYRGGPRQSTHDSASSGGRAV